MGGWVRPPPPAPLCPAEGQEILLGSIFFDSYFLGPPGNPPPVRIPVGPSLGVLKRSPAGTKRPPPVPSLD